MSNESQQEVGSVLETLKVTHPALAGHLQRTEENRQAVLAQYKNGVRLKGLEQLLHHLDDVKHAFSESKDLAKIAFLISRAKADFVTAIEATLSGYLSIAFDSMRDVMEIEFLLRDFAAEPYRIDDWLSASEKQRYDNYRPAVLRQRHANRLHVQPQDLSEASDYRGHSMTLHVSPHLGPYGGRGLSDRPEPFNGDSCFWDIFEHARRLVLIVFKLIQQLGAETSKNPDLERTFRTPLEPVDSILVIFQACISYRQNTQQIQ